MIMSHKYNMIDVSFWGYTICLWCHLTWKGDFFSTMGKSLYLGQLSVRNWQNKKENSVYFTAPSYFLTTTESTLQYFTHYWSIKASKFLLLRHYKTQNIRKPRKKLNIVYCLFLFFMNWSILSFDYITQNINYSSFLLRLLGNFNNGSFD